MGKVRGVRRLRKPGAIVEPPLCRTANISHRLAKFGSRGVRSLLREDESGLRYGRSEMAFQLGARMPFSITDQPGRSELRTTAVQHCRVLATCGFMSCAGECAPLSAASSRRPYSGNFSARVATSLRTRCSTAASPKSCRTLGNPSGDFFHFRFAHSARRHRGIPMRIPPAFIGGSGSNGIEFLLTVMPERSSASSASRPVIPLECISTRNK